MTYAPQPGYPPNMPYGPPGYGGWDGSAESAEAIAAVIGVAFTEDLTGNIDFAIAATMTVACTVLTFAVVLFFRLDFVRWILGFVAVIPPTGRAMRGYQKRLGY